MANKELGGQPEMEDWVRQIRTEMKERRLEMEEDLAEYYLPPNGKRLRGSPRRDKSTDSIAPNPKYL